MTSDRPEDLSQLLGSASDEDRQAVLAFLLQQDTESAAALVRRVELVEHLRIESKRNSEDGSQLMKIRIPTSTFMAYQNWCTANGLTLAAATRGLIQMLLDETGH